jgi:hypothetical protein
VLLGVLDSEQTHDQALLWECENGAQAIDLTGVQLTGSLIEQVSHRIEQSAPLGGLELGPVVTPPSIEWPPAARLVVVFGLRCNSQAVVSADGSRRVMVWSVPADMDALPAAADLA